MGGVKLYEVYGEAAEANYQILMILGMDLSIPKLLYVCRSYLGKLAALLQEHRHQRLNLCSHLGSLGRLRRDDDVTGGSADTEIQRKL